MGFLFTGVLLVGGFPPQEDDCVNHLPPSGRLAQLYVICSWNKYNSSKPFVFFIEPQVFCCDDSDQLLGIEKATSVLFLFLFLG